MKSPRSNFGSTFLNSKLYIAGGFNGKEVVNNFEYYHKKHKKWKELIKMPYKKKDFCLVTDLGITKNIYVIGGIDDKEYVHN